MDTDRWMAGLKAHAHSLRCEVSAVKASEHITPSVWWTGLLLKSLSHPRGCVWWRGRLRREGKWNGTVRTRGVAKGRYTSARWHRLLCNWAPKLFIHQPSCPHHPPHTPTPPTPPHFFFFLPRLHCHCGGLLDLKHRFEIRERQGGSLYSC